MNIVSFEVKKACKDKNKVERNCLSAGQGAQKLFQVLPGPVWGKHWLFASFQCVAVSERQWAFLIFISWSGRASLLIRTGLLLKLEFGCRKSLPISHLYSLFFFRLSLSARRVWISPPHPVSPLPGCLSHYLGHFHSFHPRTQGSSAKELSWKKQDALE